MVIYIQFLSHRIPHDIIELPIFHGPHLVRARMGLQEAPKGATADATNSGPEREGSEFHTVP